MTKAMKKPEAPQLPVCVDLDGTLIFTDVTWETLSKFVMQYPWKVFHLIGWLTLGRACLKHNLAEHIQIDVKRLRYNKALIEYLKNLPHDEVYLVTAADQKMGKAVADHLGIFKDVIGSDGETNLRAQAKADHLVERFGEKNFIYAGNSHDDLYVWKHAAAAIPVNTSEETRKLLGHMTVEVIEV